MFFNVDEFVANTRYFLDGVEVEVHVNLTYEKCVFKCPLRACSASENNKFRINYAMIEC